MLRILSDSRRWFVAPVLVGFASLAGLAACKADRIFSEGSANTIASVVLSPTIVSVTPGRTTRIAATPMDAEGHAVSGRSITWASSDTSIARVSDGLITALRIGSASITASVDGVSATGAVDVTPAPVASVQVSLNAGSIAVLQQTQATAVVRDAVGATLTGRTVTWASSNTGVASVDAAGLVRGVGVGTATITATSEGQSGSANVTVTPQQVASISLAPGALSLNVGQSSGIAATLRDGGGNVVSGRQPNWSSASSAIATVNSSGTVSAVAVGSTTITASIDGVSSTASVTVVAASQPLPVVTPSSLSLTVGTTGTLTAQMRDPSGNPVPATFTWATSNAAAATVDATGRVSAVAVGSATITATADGKSASAQVTVTPAPVASVTLSPTSLALVAGQSGTLAATCRDAAGAPLTGRTVTWSSSATGVATVDVVGSVRGVSAGSATITATCEGRTATASVTVQRPPVASITISPTTVSISAGAVAQLTARALDASGATINGVTFTWTTSSAAVATVSSGGLVTGIAAGSANITAAADGRSATRAVTVTAGGSTAAEPPPGANIVFSDNFDGATSAGQGYATRGDMELVTGRDGTGKALRFPYTAASSDNLIEKNISTVTEFYFSYWYRTSPGADPTCGGRNPSGMKWLMFWRANGPRYTNGVGDLDNGGPGAPQTVNEFTTHDNSSTRMPNPFLQNISKAKKFGTTNDGQWHRYTIHVVTGNGGYEQIWVDGVLVLDNQQYAYDHAAEGISMFQLPGLMVAGVSTGCAWTLDVDDLRIWRP